MWGFGKLMSSAEDIAVLWSQYYIVHNGGLTSVPPVIPSGGYCDVW